MDCQLPDGMANFAAVTLNPRLEWEEGELGGRAFSWALCYPGLPLASNCLLHMETSIDDVQNILTASPSVSDPYYIANPVCPGLLNLRM